MKIWKKITDVSLKDIVAETSIQAPTTHFFIKNYCDKPVVLRGEKAVRLCQL